MEIIKNNKKYWYNIPTTGQYDYKNLIEKLSELDVERTRINYKYCWLYSNKKILTKLKKHFKDVKFDGIDDYDQTYMYTITLLNDKDFNNFWNKK
jgi:hypothetical protein